MKSASENPAATSPDSMITGGMTRLRSVPWMLGAPGLHRFFGVKDGRQHLVLDHDQVQRLLGRVFAHRRDRSHPIAKETHLVGQDVLVAHQ